VRQRKKSLFTIRCFAGLTLVELILGGADTKASVDAAGKQTTAAEEIKDAADKSATASRDFADTAGLVNGSIGDAVVKFFCDKA
jgi:hypothetical protein